MKTIFILIYDGDTEKNILRSGTLDILKKANLRVVLLIRKSKDFDKLSYYKEHFADKNILVEEIPSAMTRFEYYMYHLSWNTLPTKSARVKRHDLYLVHKNRLRYFAESLVGLMGKFSIWRNIIRALYYWIPDNYCEELFEKYKPELVFAVNMFSAEDCRILRLARKRGIKTLTMAKSWDVPTTRGFTRVKADRILVFNEINKKEIIEIGDYSPEKVFVVGFPQFDVYSKNETYVSKEEFFKHIRADSDKRLILFAVPGDFKNPFSHEIMEDLNEAIETGKIKNVQVLARFHPKYPSKGEELKGLKNFIMDRPGTYFSNKMEGALDAPQSSAFQWTYTDKDIKHLANSIKHSDLVINTESTMTLDAVAHDKPIVLIGFDGRQRLEYSRSIIRNYSREHLKEVLETGGAKLAKSNNDLVHYINSYLENPHTDEKGRELMRKRLLYKLDGQSSKRIAMNIINMLESK